MGILFLVVLVDMLGLTLVIPFLTYFVQDLASAEGIVDTGSRDFWVGIVIATYSLAQFISTPILGAISDRCLLYTSPSPRDATLSRMPSSA